MHYARWARHGDPLKHLQGQASPEERFFRFVVKREVCWEWTGNRQTNGYGAFGISYGVSQPAHRFSYELHKGKIPPGMFILHACDNRLCVNPDHLSVGTALDNALDRESKGRGNQRCPIGEGNPNNKLTEDAVRDIRFSAETGSTMAQKYAVSQSVVSQIRRGVTWKHVT